VEEDTMKPFKMSISLVLLLVVQMFISDNTSYAESINTSTHDKKNISFDKNQAIHKSLPLNKIKNDAAIILTMHLPEGSHLIKDAGSSYTLALREKILIEGTILSDETTVKIPKLQDTNSPLMLYLNYYYCTKKGVCLFQLTGWTIPVELRQNGSKIISVTEIPLEIEKERNTTNQSF
jgi:hypothetical protein